MVNSSIESFTAALKCRFRRLVWQKCHGSHQAKFAIKCSHVCCHALQIQLCTHLPIRIQNFSTFPWCQDLKQLLQVPCHHKLKPLLKCGPRLGRVTNMRGRHVLVLNLFLNPIWIFQQMIKTTFFWRCDR